MDAAAGWEADTSRNWEEEYRAEKERHEADIADLKSELIKARSEADIFRSLYTDMTDRAMGRVVNA
jgi:hypothetical protein